MGVITHGLSKTDTYVIWYAMRRRCISKKSMHYKRYGAKGIKICSRWSKSFEYFLIDMGFRPSKEHSIDRINNKKGYYPSNCRWATSKVQMRNKSDNVWLEYDGLRMILRDWAAYLGVFYQNLDVALKTRSFSDIVEERKKKVKIPVKTFDKKILTYYVYS